MIYLETKFTFDNMKSFFALFVLCALSILTYAQSSVKVDFGRSVPLGDYAAFDTSNRNAGFAGDGFSTSFSFFNDGVSASPVFSFGFNSNPYMTEGRAAHYGSQYKVVSSKPYRQQYIAIGGLTQSNAAHRVRVYLVAQLGLGLTHTASYIIVDSVGNYRNKQETDSKLNLSFIGGGGLKFRLNDYAGVHLSTSFQVFTQEHPIQFLNIQNLQAGFYMSWK